MNRIYCLLNTIPREINIDEWMDRANELYYSDFLDRDKIKELENDICNDRYSKNILKTRFFDFKTIYITNNNFIKKGLPIRHQNMPEDISENITKFIIKKYEKDYSCVWCKGIGVSGDLKSDIYKNIEVKSFTSNGPIQFGPHKEFDVLYFLDLRNWIQDKIILWKVDLTNHSEDFMNIKVNKIQTISQQIKQGRRPRISWNDLYKQLLLIKNCEKIYDGNFNDIIF